MRAGRLTSVYVPDDNFARLGPDREVFIGRPEGSDEILTIVPHGLTKADLMGELVGTVPLPAYQLALPFSQTVWRKLQYAQGLTGMSL